MGAITDLLNNGRGLLAVLLVVAATILTALGKIDPAAWTTFVTWIFGIFTVGHTVVGATTVIAGGGKAPTAPPAA
jgi:hypothetical protein